MQDWAAFVEYWRGRAAARAAMAARYLEEGNLFAATHNQGEAAYCAEVARGAFFRRILRVSQ